jgi:KDO2-lipid IV(A) lauroyltransferase
MEFWWGRLGLKPVKLIQWAEGLAVRAVFGLLWMLPPATAMALLGWVFGIVGPRIRSSQRMRNTFALGFPTLNDAELDARVKKSWVSFGRTVATIPHLHNFVASRRGARITLQNTNFFQELEGKAMVVCGAHVGNWEVAAAMPKGRSRQAFISYNPAPNPYIETLIQNYRAATGNGFVRKEQIPRVGAQTLRRGDLMYFTIDQRVEPGDSISFLGLPALASRFPARLAVKYGCPIQPLEAVWKGGAHYEVLFHAPLYPDTTIADEDARSRDLMLRMFRVIEGMVRDRPDEWFCLKARWNNAERAVILKNRPAAEALAVTLQA